MFYGVLLTKPFSRCAVTSGTGACGTSGAETEPAIPFGAGQNAESILGGGMIVRRRLDDARHHEIQVNARHHGFSGRTFGFWKNRKWAMTRRGRAAMTHGESEKSVASNSF